MSVRSCIVPSLTHNAQSATSPSLHIFLEVFLRLEIVDDEDDGAIRKEFCQERSKKRLCRQSDTGTRQCAAFLQSPCEGLHSGSSDDPVEQTCRRDLEILRQAAAKSQEASGTSSCRGLTEGSVSMQCDGG